MVYKMVATEYARAYTHLVRPTSRLPEAPPFRLERHQLAQVLCQVRFSPVLLIRKDEAVVGFQERIRGDYPRYQRQETAGVVITPQGLAAQGEPVVHHRFEDVDGRYTVILTTEFVALETSDYVDVGDFAPRIARLVAAVGEEFRPAEVQRIGLRFINELRFGGKDYRAAMRRACSTAFLGPLGSEELIDAVDGSFQVIELAGADTRMLIRHGLQRAGTTVDPALPRPRAVDLQQPFYLIDLDVFSEQAVPFEPDAVEPRVRQFNDDIRTFFAWAVTEQFRRSVLGQVDG